MICFALYSAAHAMQQAYKPLLDGLGITYPQYLVLSVLWDVNAFDQWGVELGKVLAQTVLKAMAGQAVVLDSSTRSLLNKSLTI